MLHHMSSTEYLNYESGKFSKSKGVGVFGTDVMETGIPADVWRFYIFYNRPEKSDFTFTWNDFLEKVNGELIGNLGNLANRTLAFIQRFYDGVVPQAQSDEPFMAEVRALESQMAQHLERAELRDAFRVGFQIADIANKRFQAAEPWKARTEDPPKAASLLSDLVVVLRDLAIIMHPYMPSAMDKLASYLGCTIGSGGLSWNDVGSRHVPPKVLASEVLFQKLDPLHVAQLRDHYAGSQKERAQRDAAGGAKIESSVQSTASKNPKANVQAEAKPTEPKKAEPKILPLADLSQDQRFSRLVDLRVAVITKIERHPKADKLYIETLDDGSGIERVIVSGLVPFYTEEQLLGKHIILVNNLKPAKLRGIESRGMLLAASHSGTEGKEIVEVIEASWATPGTKVYLDGTAQDASPLSELDADTFFSIPITAQSNSVVVSGRTLMVDQKPLTTSLVPNGEVG